MTTSNSLQMFSNSSFNVRVVMRDNKPWFVAKDVAACIEHKDVSTMCKLCRKKDVLTINGKEYSADLAEYSEGRGNPNICVISESGLYRILAKCNLPECEPFESWVFDEVLPSIRQKGYYSIAPRDSYLIEDPIERAKAWIAEQEEKKRVEQERDEAIRTKTLYHEGLASEMSGRVGGLQKANNSLRKENSELKDAVGRGCNWRTVSMMKAEWIKEFGHVPSWQKLKQFSKDVGIPPVQDVEEKVVLKDGSEKTTVSYRYHKEAWARYKKYEENLRVSPDEVSLV